MGVLPWRRNFSSHATSTADMVAIAEAHSLAIQKQLPTYTDPSTGYEVFTRVSLLTRNKCCGNVCRHCPYGYHNVSERLITQLDLVLERRVEEKVLLRTPNRLFSAFAPPSSSSSSSSSSSLALMYWSGEINSFINLARILAKKVGMNESAVDTMKFDDKSMKGLLRLLRIQQDNPRIVLFTIFDQDGNIYNDSDSDLNLNNDVRINSSIEKVMIHAKLLELDLMLIPMHDKSFSECINEGIEMITANITDRECQLKVVYCGKGGVEVEVVEGGAG